MKAFRWDPGKSDLLKRKRGVSFEDILLLGALIDDRRHPTRPHQNVLLFELDGYVWLAPYVENDQEIFLKTLYPSRKHTRLYLEGRIQNENTPEDF